MIWLVLWSVVFHGRFMESVHDKTSSVAERATFAFLEANAREKGRWTEKVHMSCLKSQFHPRNWKKQTCGS